MVVVESHQQVLAAWAQYRNALPSAPRLITLDHHTDTNRPFQNRLHSLYKDNPSHLEEVRATWLSNLDYKNADSVKEAIEKLSNDEHILAAIQSDVISSAFVIAHNARDTDLSVYTQYRIICRSVDREPHSKKATREECDRVLESFFLNEMIDGFNEILHEANERPLLNDPYILDIDLDYFNTRRSIAPIDPLTIQTLAKNAGLITIATEPAYVQHCALDGGLSSEAFLIELKKIIESPHATAKNSLS